MLTYSLGISMKPNSRVSFAQYCLRNLGAPVIEINVDDDQIDDRIDEAIQYYTTYHYEGVQKTYLKHQITADDKTEGKIHIPDYVYGVTRIIPFSNVVSSSNLFFDVTYQLMLSDLYNLTSTDVLYYTMLNQHITMLNDLLNAVPSFEYNKKVGYLTFPNSPEGLDRRLNVGDYIILECYRAVDPNEFTKVYDDYWLKRYATALIKRQWGANLKKFSNMVLPGGITIDGNGIYDEAIGEIRELEDELNTKLAPLNFFMG
jgi:hypothetical protein